MDKMIVTNVKEVKKRPGTITFNIKKTNPLRKGKVFYNVFRKEILECLNYEESDDEDIYWDIHDWVSKHVKINKPLFKIE